MSMNRSTLLGLTIALVGVAAACSDDAADSLRRGGGPGSSSGSNGAVDPNAPGANGSGIAHEEELFNALEAEFSTKCGNACHGTAESKPAPPKFLEGADTQARYKTIKAYPGIVVPDIYQSAVLVKGAHAGPALNTDPEFEKKVIAWLTAEALALTSVAAPTTDPVTVTQGANEIDLSKAATGITGVKLKFDATVLSGMLSLSNMKLVAPAGTDTHISKPRFIRVLEAPVNGKQQFIDPADTFSNLDQTTAGGTEAVFGPGSALFSGEGWRPYDLAKDKIRIEIQKLEKGTVQVTAGQQQCKNVPMFQANVLPALRGTGFTPNCQNCHGNGLAGLQLGSNDAALVCLQVMGKLNQANIGQSLMVTKVSGGGVAHNGGQVNDVNAWRAVFVNNAAAFF